jgi:hypothetical protein
MDAVIDMPSSTTTGVGSPRLAGPTVLGFDQFYDALSAAFVPVKVVTPSVTTSVGDPKGRSSGSAVSWSDAKHGGPCFVIPS